MGGSTPKPPKQPTPMETAQANEWAAQQQWNREQAAAEAERVRVANELAATKAKTAGDVNRFFTGGSDYLTQELADLGYADTYGIAKDFNQALARQKELVPETATDVGKYFNYEDLFNTAVAGAQNRQQTSLQNALTALTPTGWQEKYFANEADDPILQEILAQQQGDLEETLKRKFERGQMSEGAYNYALGQIGQLSSGAMSNLQNIGGGVLSKYRTQLGDLANAFGQQVSGYKLGQQVNPADWGTQLTSKQGQLQGTLKGDILSALGNTQLFDPNALIAKSGSQAGPSNQPVLGSNPQGTGQVPLEETEQRTTGTTGIF